MLMTPRAISGVCAAMASAAKPPVEWPTSSTGHSPTNSRMAAVNTAAMLSAVKSSGPKLGGKAAG
jgi:hypothetical protein